MKARKESPRKECLDRIVERMVGTVRIDSCEVEDIYECNVYSAKNRLRYSYPSRKRRYDPLPPSNLHPWGYR